MWACARIARLFVSVWGGVCDVCKVGECWLTYKPTNRQQRNEQNKRNKKTWSFFKWFARKSNCLDAMQTIASMAEYSRHHFSMASTAYSIVHSFFTRQEHSGNTRMTFSWPVQALWLRSHSSRSLWKCPDYSNSSADVNAFPKKVRTIVQMWWRKRSNHLWEKSIRVGVYCCCFFIPFRLSYSFGVSDIESHLRWDQSTHRKLDAGHLFFYPESHAGLLDISKICAQPISILHHRYGTRCTQITHSNVVSWMELFFFAQIFFRVFHSFSLIFVVRGGK